MDKELIRLVEVMAKLRGPQGCPWDKQQDHNSIKNYLVEEVYELIDAIENKDWENFKEELGDVLFQVIFHCQMAQEFDRFDLKDVLQDISDKMIRRHPHVFNDNPTDNIDEVLLQWDEIKKQEKTQQQRESVFDDIPQHLPALHKTLKAYKKAAKHNLSQKFSTQDSSQAIQQLIQQWSEKSNAPSQEQLGELLFYCVQLAEEANINPEEVLRNELKQRIKTWKFKEKSDS